MEIVYDESTGTWGEREEPYTTLDVQTEEDWNKLEFMINNFSKLEEENKELKRLLRLAIEDINRFARCVDFRDCKDCCMAFTLYSCKWKHAEEAMKILEDKNG